MKPRATPRVTLLLLVLLAAAGVLMALRLALVEPWLGIGLTGGDGGRGLRVRHVSADSPVAERVLPGQRLLLLESADGNIELEANDLLEEPDFSPSYASFNRFMARQNRIATLLTAQQITLNFADGARVAVSPESRRPLADLPVAFWFQMVFGVMCLGIGAAVWAYRRDRATGLSALSGGGLYLVGLTAAIYSTRELALPGELFISLAAANHAGGMLFGAAFVGLLLNYPTTLVRGRTVLLLVLGFAVIWVLECLQWLPGMEFGFRIPLIAALAVTVPISVLQWRRIREPGDRVAFRWFVFPLFIGATLFQAVLFVPLLLDVKPLVPQSYSFGLLLLIFAGMAVGVARYGLFQLQRLWYPALAGSAALLAAVVALPLLAQFVELSQVAAVAISLAVLGWVYFPLYSGLRQRRNALWRARAAPVLSEGVRVLLDPGRQENMQNLWEALLQQVYRPVEIATVNQAPPAPEISGDGACLVMPATVRTTALALRWPDNSSRLFDESDLRLAQALLPLTTHAWDIRKAWEAGGRAERSRIKADLEDDLGARIYMQILRAPEEHVAIAQRAALAEVRLVIDQLEVGVRPLSECLAEWQSQITDYCDLANVNLRWTVHGGLSEQALHATARANPLRILREVLANAVQHAHPTHIEVAVNVDFPQLGLEVTHDGATAPPAEWPSGRGLLNIQARVRQMRGEIGWQELDKGRVQMRCDLTLTPAEGHERA